MVAVHTVFGWYALFAAPAVVKQPATVLQSYFQKQGMGGGGQASGIHAYLKLVDTLFNGLVAS